MDINKLNRALELIDDLDCLLELMLKDSEKKVQPRFFRVRANGCAGF